MEEGDLPPVSSAPSSAGGSDCTSSSQPQTVQMPSADSSGGNGILDERLAVLQELYQRRHAELLAQFQHTQTLAQQDYLLNLQLLQSALPAAAAMVVLQQQQINSGPATTGTTTAAQGAAHNPLLGSLTQTSSEQSTEEFDPIAAAVSQQQQQQCNSVPLTTSCTTKDHGQVTATARNRRTFSGSGQTISQHTRDRLKSMIATKKQKQRLHSSSSAGSTSNIAATLNGAPSSNWSQTTAGGAATPEMNLLASTGSATEQSMPATVVTNSHIDQRFLPYPHPAHHHRSNDTSNTAAAATASSGSLSAEYQLRKVNSEPNLKMRIRARLLNKGSSPHQQQSVNTAATLSSQTPSMQKSHQQQRPDSNGASGTGLDIQSTQPTTLEAALLFQQAAQQALTGQHLSAASSNLMVPSPSLPNLPTTATLGNVGPVVNKAGIDGTPGALDSSSQQDLINLMSLQNTFMHFLSMPSLLKSPLLPTNSMFDPPQTLADSSSSSSTSSGLSVGSMQRTVRFDNRTAAPMSLGYPSLLKQQLRDLVLRRKSLVREEPEDDTMMDFQNNRTQVSANGQSVAGFQLKTGLAYDQSMSKHQCLCSENNNHVEHGGRVQSIWSRLIESGLVSACERVIVRKAPLEILRLVHSSTYVTFFAVSPTACLKLDPAELPLKSFVQLPCGGIGVDSDTYFNDASTQTAAKMAVGSLVELCCQVVEGKIRNGFACIRPPGHHAEREQAMGFCFFNNVAIAARYLQQRFANVCSRIAIIDWDVHHGNGTQLCFESDPNCLYLSLHRHDNGNFFPGTGAVTEVGVGEGKGTTVNIPFSGDIMGDAEYLAAWRVLVIPLLDTFKPDFILVSSGFDATQGHPAALGGYNLSPKLFGYLTRTLMQFANGRVVLALEGGYDLSSICDSAEECVKALCLNGGDITNLSPEILEQVPNQSAQETIQKVIAVHKKHWPCLTGVQGINTSELHWQTISHRFSSLTVHS